MQARTVDNYLEATLNLLAPRRCCWCQARIARGHSCPACRQRLPWNPVACARCALPLPGPGPGEFLCPACAGSPPPQDLAFVPFRYEGPISAQIVELKFRAGLHRAPVLAELLALGLAARPRPLPELLVPVPLHPARLFRRGYNQALEIARPLASRLTVALAPDAARRRRATGEQTRLSAGQRRRNVRGAFEVDPLVRGRHVALLDDVITTGATAAELARTTRAAGAVGVEVWAVARATLSA